MCLNSITKTYDPPDPTIRKAWKMVRIEDGEFYSPYQNSSKLTNAWASASKEQVNIWGTDQRYLAGFHVFPDEQTARKAFEILVGQHGIMRDLVETGSAKIVPVEVRGVMYEGQDGTSTYDDYYSANLLCLVAEEIRLASE